MVKAVLFDHDGTLVDSEGLHCRHWQTVLSAYDIDLTEEIYKATMAGIPTPTNAENLLAKHGLRCQPETLVEQKGEATRAFLAVEAFTLMPGAEAAIQRFHGAGFKVGVVTGAGPSGITATLKAYDLARFVDVVVTGADVAESKPAPDCYLLALERLALSAADCAAVEDTEHGVQAARSAGIRCAAVPNAYSAHQDFTSANAVFESMRQAADWLADGTA